MTQHFKSVCFKNKKGENKNVTLAFNDKEKPLYNKLNDLTSEEIRNLAKIKTYDDLLRISDKDYRTVNQYLKKVLKTNLPKNGVGFRDVTFAGSKEVPFQRWYPYIEGYSPEFIDYIVDKYCQNVKKIYDPFGGTGTTLFSASYKNIESDYSEINPLLTFLTEVKIEALSLSPKKRLKLSSDLKKIAESLDKEILKYPKSSDLDSAHQILFKKSIYFPKSNYATILRLRSYIDKLKTTDVLLANLMTIAVLSSLLPASYLKKAGDVRFKNKKELEKKIEKIEDILSKKIEDISVDISNLDYTIGSDIKLIINNAKKIGTLPNQKYDSVITSPPYLNGTNYLRNTKVELWFLRNITKENDLRLYRDQILTSGINDVSSKSANPKRYLEKIQSPLLEKTLLKLEKNTYDKRITIMAQDYFEEMLQVFGGMQKHLRKNARVCIDLGDSIFAGVHIKTDEILIEILTNIGYKLVDQEVLRLRRSRNKASLQQVLLVFEFAKQKNSRQKKLKPYWKNSWDNFKTNRPYQQAPFSKRNWGHINHSLCSYQGKLKPSIAHHLINTFVPKDGTVLDPFVGVGSIPFEAALTGRKSYGIDISYQAYVVSNAKTSICDEKQTLSEIDKLSHYIRKNKVTKKELLATKKFGFNKKISDYYDKKTLNEILLARQYYKKNPPETSEQMMVLSSLLHILHGNRPYALSRRSHPIVPYAPQGDFIYKDLISSLRKKVEKSVSAEFPKNFVNGDMYNMDATELWPQEIQNLDAIITSPPFFDSTRFHLANWIRLWFGGWDEEDFKLKPNLFIDEKQKISFKIYENIFRQSRERLKPGGVMILHLGKSKKSDMAKELERVASRWFETIDIFDESVDHCESFGIRDVGTVTSHQYLVLK